MPYQDLQAFPDNDHNDECGNGTAPALGFKFVLVALGFGGNSFRGFGPGLNFQACIVVGQNVPLNLDLITQFEISDNFGYMAIQIEALGISATFRRISRTALTDTALTQP